MDTVVAEYGLFPDAQIKDVKKRTVAHAGCTVAVLPFACAIVWRVAESGYSARVVLLTDLGLTYAVVFQPVQVFLATAACGIGINS